MSFHFKLLGAQYFNEISWKKIGKALVAEFFNRRKSVRRKKYHMRSKSAEKKCKKECNNITNNKTVANKNVIRSCECNTYVRAHMALHMLKCEW